MGNDLLYGFLAVTASIISFGFYAIPIKSKKVQEAKVSPMVFHFYSGTAVGLTCFLVLIYNPFIWSWWGVLSGTMYVINQPLFFGSLPLVGYTICPPVVAGLTIILSFLWGALFFHEPVRNIWLAILGIAVLITGIVGVTLSGSGVVDKVFNRYQNYKRLKSRESSMMMQNLPPEDGNEENEGTEGNERNKGNEGIEGIEGNEGNEGNDLESDVSQLQPSASPNKRSPKDFLIGFMMASTVGLLNGSLMVPFTFFAQEQEINYPGEFVQLAFLTSFGVGVFLSTPVVSVIYFLVKREKPVLHFKVTVLPGLLAGILWSLGNFCSLYGVYYLGNTVGYPLTQSNIIIPGFFGIFYFKEIRGKAIAFFGLSVVVLFAGMGLLSYFGGH